MTIRANSPDRTTEHDTGARLKVPGSRDEIAALAAGMNALLDRLQRALARQRGFVADAGHELRTPLTALKAELELAARPGRSRQALADAAGDTDRLIRLAEDLLLARADEGSGLGGVATGTAFASDNGPAPVTSTDHQQNNNQSSSGNQQQGSTSGNQQQGSTSGNQHKNHQSTSGNQQQGDPSAPAAPQSDPNSTGNYQHGNQTAPDTPGKKEAEKKAGAAKKTPKG